MARQTITVTTCDICGAKDEDDFWAEVTFRSRKYEYDDGTNPQDYNWTLCRRCKVILLDFMEFAAKQPRKEEIGLRQMAGVIRNTKRRTKRQAKPKGPETCFERVSKGVLDP